MSATAYDWAGRRISETDADGNVTSFGYDGASRLKQVFDDDHKFYEIIRDTMVAHLHGQPPQISIEIGRKSVPSEIQPTFAQLEEATQAIPLAA